MKTTDSGRDQQSWNYSNQKMTGCPEYYRDVLAIPVPALKSFNSSRWSLNRNDFGRSGSGHLFQHNL